MHRLQTRRLAPLLPAPASTVAIIPADDVAGAPRNPAPEPLRAPTAEELALEAKKRQAAELRRQLDEVLAEVDGHKAWLAPKPTGPDADAAPAEQPLQPPQEAWREAGPQPQFKVHHADGREFPLLQC